MSITAKFLTGLLCLIGCIINSGSIHGQTCGTPDHYWQNGLYENLRTISDRPEGASSRSSYELKLVFHIVRHPSDRYISDAVVHEQIATLNRAFSVEDRQLHSLAQEFEPLLPQRDRTISFCLAERKNNGNLEKGIVRKSTTVEAIGIDGERMLSATEGSVPWAQDSFVNIWVVGLGGNLLGYASYPDSTLSAKDGIAIDPAYFGTNSSDGYDLGKVLVHEMGHYLGLSHPWGDCSGEGDGIEDTPAQDRPYNGCPTYPQVSCSSNDLYQNYMDYVDDRCMVKFTQGQYQAMQLAIELLRPSLIGVQHCYQWRSLEPRFERVSQSGLWYGFTSKN